MLHNRAWGDFNENAAYLSVGASERMAAPDTGDLSPEYLRSFQPPVADRAAKVDALERALTAKRVRVSLSPPTSPARLAVLSGATDGNGANLWVVYCPTPTIADATVKAALANREAGEAVYVAAPYTPPIAGGNPYRRLGFLVAAGPGIAPGSLLTSPTTRTPGVVANVDIAPTIAALYGAAIPGAAGQPVHAVPARDPWATLSSIERATNAAARASIPVLLGYGIWAGVSLTLALLTLWRRQPVLVPVARFAMLCSASALLALLPVGLVAPQSALAYGLVFAAFSVALAVAAHLASRYLRQEPLRLIFLALVLAVTVDGFFGSPVLGRTLLSGNFLSGIRFYGIGNEYMGITVGAAATALAPWWLCVPIVGAIGLPYCGADAGGTIGSVVTFAVLFFARRGKLKLSHLVAAFAFAFVVTAAFALLDRLQPGTARSHVGAAVATGENHGGLRALAEIVLRKISMNLRLALSPWTMVGLIPSVLVGIGISRLVRSSSTFQVALKKRGLPDVALPATVWGALATAVFNDSGIVAAVLMFLPLMASLLDAMLSGTVEQDQHALHGD